jgi:L-rhamnose-H+ transport protein
MAAPVRNENVWLLWAVFALVVFPEILLLLTIPDFAEIYKTVGIDVLAVVMICGMALGLCQVCFGLAVELVGVALTFSVASGVAAGAGSIAPLLLFHLDVAFTRSGEPTCYSAYCLSPLV